MTILRRGQAHLRTAIDSAMHGVLFTDALGRIVFHNETAARLFGYEPGELRGLEIGTLIPADLGVETKELLAAPPANLILAFTDATFDARACRKDGSRFVTDVMISSADSDGATVYTLVLRDITARLADEEAKHRLQLQLAEAHKLESVGRLAAGVAHEINTPTQYVGDNLHFLHGSLNDLRKVLDAYRTAARAGSPTEQRAAADAADALANKLDLDYLADEIPRAIEQALEGTKQIAGIVSAMKTFCHPGRPDKAPVDLNAAIENTVSISRNEWKYVARIEFALTRDLPHVSCNENEIKQVLLNLIVNAAQAIEEKHGTRGGAQGAIRVASRQVGAFAEIEVTDAGPGIPESAMARLFDPFFTTKAVGKGTGQGLAIAHSIIVDRHGGEIVVQSPPGRGATFLLRLPL